MGSSTRSDPHDPPPSVWFQLRHDVDVKKQLLTICWVAVVLALFELVFFLRIIVPQVRTAMGGMLRQASGGQALGGDHPATPYARAVLATMNAREAELIAATRRGAVLNGVLIVALPLVVIAALYAGSPPLRAARKRDVLWDVLITVGAIIAFQIVFYFLAFRVTPPLEKTQAVGSHENRRGSGGATRRRRRWSTAPRRSTTRRRAASSSARGAPPSWRRAWPPPLGAWPRPFL